MWKIPCSEIHFGLNEVFLKTTFTQMETKHSEKVAEWWHNSIVCVNDICYSITDTKQKNKIKKARKKKQFD